MGHQIPRTDLTETVKMPALDLRDLTEREAIHHQVTVKMGALERRRVTADLARGSTHLDAVVLPLWARHPWLAVGVAVAGVLGLAATLAR